MEEKPKFTKPQLFFRMLLLILLIVGTVLLLLNRDKIQHLEVYGYPGIFLIWGRGSTGRTFGIPGGVWWATHARKIRKSQKVDRLDAA